MSDILEISPPHDGVFEAELSSRQGTPWASPNTGDSSQEERSESDRSEAPEMEVDSDEESADTPRTGSVAAVCERLKASEAYKEFLVGVEAAKTPPKSDFQIPKLPRHVRENTKIDMERKSILGNSQYAEVDQPTTTRGVEEAKAEANSLEAQTMHKPIAGDFGARDIRYYPSSRTTDSDEAARRSHRDRTDTQVERGRSLRQADMEKYGTRPKEGTVEQRLSRRYRDHSPIRPRQRREDKSEWRAAPSRDDRHVVQQQSRRNSREEQTQRNDGRSQTQAETHHKQTTREHSRERRRHSSSREARERRTDPHDDGRAMTQGDDRPPGLNRAIPTSSEDIDERVRPAPVKVHDQDERVKVGAAEQPPTARSYNVGVGRGARLQQELIRQEGRQKAAAARMTAGASKRDTSSPTQPKPKSPGDAGRDSVSGLFLGRVRYARAPVRAFNIATPVTRWMLTEVLKVPTSYKVFNDGAPHFTSLPGYIPKASEKDTVLRRRLQSPWLTLVQEPVTALRPIDENLPRYSEACRRCSHEGMNIHDSGTCRRSTTEYMNTILCPYCLCTENTRADYDRHYLQCYGRGANRRTAKWRDWCLAEPTVIRPRYCTVKGCGWNSHIFSMWFCHTAIHRFLALCYGLRTNDLRVIFMGGPYDWTYIPSTREYLPPLAIIRLVTTILPLVNATDSVHRWYVRFGYSFPHDWDNPNNQSGQFRDTNEQWPHFSDVLRYTEHVPLAHIANVTQPGIVNSLQQVLDLNAAPTFDEWGSRVISIEKKTGKSHMSEKSLDILRERERLREKRQENDVTVSREPKERTSSEEKKEGDVDEVSKSGTPETESTAISEIQKGQTSGDTDEDVLVVPGDSDTLFTCNVDEEALSKYEGALQQHSSDSEESSSSESEGEEEEQRDSPAAQMPRKIGGAADVEPRAVSGDFQSVQLSKKESSKTQKEKKRERKQKRREREREEKANKQQDQEESKSRKELRKEKKKLRAQEKSTERQRQSEEGQMSRATDPLMYIDDGKMKETTIRSLEEKEEEEKDAQSDRQTDTRTDNGENERRQTASKRTNEMLTPNTIDVQIQKRTRSDSDDEFTVLKESENVHELSAGMDSSGYTTPVRSEVPDLEEGILHLKTRQTPPQIPVPPGLEATQQQVKAALRLARQRTCSWGEVPPVANREEVFERSNFVLCRVMRGDALPSLRGIMRSTTTGVSIKHVAIFGQLGYEMMSVQFGVNGSSLAVFSKGGAPAAMSSSGVSVALWEIGGLRPFVGILYIEDDVSEHDCVGFDSNLYASAMVDCVW